MCTFGGPAEPFAGLGPVARVFVAAVSPLLGFVFFLPAVGLLKLARLVRIPRGFRDVLTGGLLGSSWLLLALYDGLTPPLAAYCLLAGGLLGGLDFLAGEPPHVAPLAGVGRSIAFLRCLFGCPRLFELASKTRWGLH